ncbi:MAG: hypothetical protein HKN27_00760, partial [Silicimonas sp.]|nr:hypothetical protein [Silicimonas sp.]
SMERKAFTVALTTMLGERLSPGRIAALYAAKAYYGRNCYGHVDAVFGLTRKTPQTADDAVWLALAALPRSPSLYLRNRSALRIRVKTIIDEMHSSNSITEQTAQRLENLPIANLSVGKGCSN